MGMMVVGGVGGGDLVGEEGSGGVEGLGAGLEGEGGMVGGGRFGRVGFFAVGLVARRPG